MTRIVIICHSDGQFSVWKDPVTGHGSAILKTRQEADARARLLQDKAESPEKTPIVVYDLTKTPLTAKKIPAAISNVGALGPLFCAPKDTIESVSVQNTQGGNGHERRGRE